MDRASGGRLGAQPAIESYSATALPAHHLIRGCLDLAVTVTSICMARNVIGHGSSECITAHAGRSEMDTPEDPGVGNLRRSRRKTRKIPSSRPDIRRRAERGVFSKLFGKDESRGPTHCRMSGRIFRMCRRAGREEIEPGYLCRVRTNSSSPNRGDRAPEHIAILYIPAGYSRIGHGHIQYPK